MIEMRGSMGQERRDKGRRIPDHEIDVSFARSGGPGGQGVNTAESKAVLRWHIGRSGAFTDAEKALIRANASNTTEGDEIVLHCSELRKQMDNRKLCVDRLHEMVNKAIVVQAPRRETKPTRGSVERKLEGKRIQGVKKANRRSVDSD